MRRPPTTSSSPFIPYLTLAVVFINSFCFAGWPDAWNFCLYDLPKNPLMVLAAMFSHGDISHLAGNMLYVLLFGPMVEKRLGSMKFVLLYLLSGLLAAFGYGYMNPETPILGASGAIAGIMAVFPFVQRNWVSMVVAGLAVWFAFFSDFEAAWSGITWGVANLAHVIGGVSGLAVLCWFRR